MNKTVLALIAVVIVVGGIVVWKMQSVGGNTTGQTTTTSGQTQTQPTAAQTSDVGAKTYTSAEVATHSGASSCWSIIDDNVYDLTNWIPQHPGGQQAILALCGKNGTAAFHGQHDDAKKQADILATMKIGVLAQ